MSRRFGRNQKRRLQERLGAALHAADREKSLSMAAAEQVSYLRGAIAGADRFARDIAHMVGSNAIAAGAPARLDFSVRGDFAMMPPQRFLSGACPVDVAPLGLVHVETMRLLRIEAIRERMTRSMHCIVRLANSRYCYAISDTALGSMGDHSIGILAEHIAAGLVHEIGADPLFQHREMTGKGRAV